MLKETKTAKPKKTTSVASYFGRETLLIKKTD